MAPGFLFLTRFLALLSLVSGGPYGNVGCHFSPVCLPDEICADDNLFGSCISLDSSHLPYYNLDPRGLREVKNSIKFLIDENLEWKDEISQGILSKILYPYQIEYLRSENPFYNEDYNEKYPARTQEEQADEGPLRLRWNGLGSGAVRSKKYAYDGRYPSNEYHSEPSVPDLVEEYLTLLNELQASRENIFQQRFQEYYNRYLKLLERYNEYREYGIPLNPPSGSAGYQKPVDDLGNKMELIKDYLQKVYGQELTDDGKFVDGAWVDEDKIWNDNDAEVNPPTVGENGDEAENLEENLAEWLDESSSSSVPTPDEIMFPESSADDTEQDLLFLLGEQLIPYLSKADREEWDKLTEDEKMKMLEQVLDTVAGFDDEDENVNPENIPKMVFPEINDGGDKRVEDAEEREVDKDDPGLVKGSTEYSEKELFLKGQVGNVEKKADDSDTLVVDLPKQGSSKAAEVTEKPSQTTTVTTSKPKTTPPASGYAYIALAEDISQDDAEALVGTLASILHVPVYTFSKVSSHGSAITFFVNPNEQKMSPAAVAASAADNGETLGSLMNVQIKETGVGKEVEIGESLKDEDNTALVVLTVILSFCVLLILGVVLSIYCIRKRSHFQAKLKGLSGNEEVEPEAKSDYQDLCRQRMATKHSEKPEPLSRISSIAQSEGAQPSPSSRSSTSSWSEEPVQSNMDISTGHVVLSYMEDHLKNQDRLSKEWEALCTYEPDSTNSSVGEDPKNSSRNRFPESLPYDHSRIILNENINSSGSDYINANAIVDTDPKAPAYIATQAPLPNTLGDFWQMVWEQGSVVIVNLTHLSESEILKTPYWPNKGSAIYHIYELHLVSEHVWCDDYLVRSFYLKNLETQETRTVTQFHFLSWTKDGVPTSPKALLEFRRKVNKSFRGRQCPIIVHCNDGVGRTGTYILIDLVLTRMTKGAKEIDIAATLEHIRDHRENLVRTKEQFEFALTAVAEEVNAILKALPQ